MLSGPKKVYLSKQTLQKNKTKKRRPPCAPFGRWGGVEVGRDGEELAWVSLALGISRPRPFYLGGSVWSSKKPRHPCSSRGRRRGLEARAGKAFLREPAAAALPELRPAGLSSPSPLLPPPLSSRSHETPSRERDIPQTQSHKSHFQS